MLSKELSFTVISLSVADCKIVFIIIAIVSVFGSLLIFSLSKCFLFYLK